MTSPSKTGMEPADFTTPSPKHRKGLPVAHDALQRSMFGVEPGAGDGGAVARRTDPRTSHEAGEKAMRDLTAKQRAVLRVFVAMEALTDEEVAAYYVGPKQSPSGLRTRRAELVKLGYLKDSGRRTLNALGNNVTIWAITEEGRAAWR